MMKIHCANWFAPPPTHAADPAYATTHSALPSLLVFFSSSVCGSAGSSGFCPFVGRGSRRSLPPSHDVVDVDGDDVIF